jgi:outer membrane protein OmpA-like peptidoglycan-associated protein
MKNIQLKFLKLSSSVVMFGLVACAHDANKHANKPNLGAPVVATAPISKPMDASTTFVEAVTGIFDAALAVWKPMNVSGSIKVLLANEDTKFTSWKSLNLPLPVEAKTTAFVEETIPQVAEIQIPKFQLKMDVRLDSLKYAVYFEYASANLNPTGKAAIEALQNDAKEAESIVVVGHADPSGDAKKNVKLANSRANSVRFELAKYGIIPQKVVTKGAVAFSKPEDRLAFRQNVPAELSAASRRADVDIAVKPNATATAPSVDKRFVTISG